MIMNNWGKSDLIVKLEHEVFLVENICKKNDDFGYRKSMDV